MIPKPVQHARRLIKKYGYENPHQIDLIDLLYAEGLYLKYETTDAYQGKIVFNNRTGIITLNDNLENECQKRYVIAHEMGHFFNEKLGIRNDKLGGKDRLERNAGRQVRVQSVEIVHEFKRDRYHDFVDANAKRIEELKREREANQFAVELLMGRKWFVEYVKGKTRQKDGGQAVDVKRIKETAEYFNVSLSAAALRFADLYNGAMAVILTNNKRVTWAAYNKNFLYPRLYKNDLLPLNNKIYDIYDKLMPTNYVENKIINSIGYRQFIKMKNDYLDSLDKTIIVNSSDWFLDNSVTEQRFFYEIDFPMMNYNSVLTILWEE